MDTKIYKQAAGYIQKVDDEQGIVDAYVSIMGIIDDDYPPDMIEMGAYKKTIQERGPAGVNKIRVLHQHSTREVVAKPLVIVEHPREMLPVEILQQYPQATGGLFTRSQFVLEVQRAREDFALLKVGAINEWSVGIDPLQPAWDQDAAGNEFRRLKEVRLWEYSPVTWGANPATTTTEVKNIEESRIIPELYELADLLGIEHGDDAEKDWPAVWEKIQKHLKEGAKPDDVEPLTPSQAVKNRLLARALEIELKIKSGD